jgi:glycosyltransferase involved in cell wall biosynthesis
MRIAMIGQKGLELGEKGGGIERHVFELSTRLVRLGHEVTVYARRRYADDGKAEQAGVSIRYVPTVYRKNLEAIVHTLLATLHALSQPYDIIHYHGVGPATLAWLPRLLKPRARVVVTFHSQDRFHAKWGFLARHYLHVGEWLACWLPHATIAVSHVIQVYARKYYRRQIVYIPNGADPQTVSSAHELITFGLEPNAYILNVSRLVPHKGQHYLINAWRKLEIGNWKLVIVGAPVYTEEYLDELKRLADGDLSIVFTGFQTGEALKQLYAHAYLYVQPSESEGLAVTVLEAMSFGTPVLVSDIPENLETLHGAGFRFRNKDVEDLKDKLAHLLAHPDEVARAADETRSVIQKHFTWETIALRTEELYRTVRH